MALSANDLYRLEKLARQHADGLRREADRYDDSSIKETRAHAALVRKEAADFDVIGGLLQGMQGLSEADRTDVLAMLRTGFDRLRDEHEALKARAAEPAEDAAA